MLILVNCARLLRAHLIEECNLVKRVVISRRKVKFTQPSRDRRIRVRYQLSVWLAWIAHPLGA